MDGTDYGRIEKAIRYLEENVGGQPALAEIARAAGLSASRFQRLFTRWAGISPKRFLQFLTAGHARELLKRSSSVLEAAYGAGLSGPGRLHDLVVGVYAETPGEIKAGGAGLEIRYGTAPTPFGDCFVAATRRGICALSFLGARGAAPALRALRAEWPGATLVPDPKAAREIARRVFAGPPDGRTARFHVYVRGTNFQVRVWEALVRIPAGAVVSYEEVAERVGSPRAVRAVGSAVGRNPVSYLIPCHRVIRKSGAFGNYGGGPARKKAILAWEACRIG